MNLKAFSVFMGSVLAFCSSSLALSGFEYESWREMLGNNKDRQQLRIIIDRDKANQAIFSDLNKSPMITNGLYYGLRSYDEMSKEEIKDFLYTSFISVETSFPYINQKPFNVFYKRAKIVVSAFDGGFSKLDRIKEAMKKPMVLFEADESINQAFMDWKTN